MRQSRNKSRAMAILAMPEHGQDARGTKSTLPGLAVTHPRIMLSPPA